MYSAQHCLVFSMCLLSLSLLLLSLLLALTGHFPSLRSTTAKERSCMSPALRVGEGDAYSLGTETDQRAAEV